VQKVTVTIALGGIDPVEADVEAHMRDMIADHMAANETEGYEVHLIAAVWDETTYEYHAAQMHDLARKCEALAKKCYANKPARINAITMVEDSEGIAKDTEKLLEKSDVKNSVDLSTIGTAVLTKCAAIGEHLVATAFPRKE